MDNSIKNNLSHLIDKHYQDEGAFFDRIGISKKTFNKWMRYGLPSTEWNGGTQHAKSIEKALYGDIEAIELCPQAKQYDDKCFWKHASKLTTLKLAQIRLVAFMNDHTVNIRQCAKIMGLRDHKILHQLLNQKEGYHIYSDAVLSFFGVDERNHSAVKLKEMKTRRRAQ